jgi:AhpD family alkylhydroperoxidase
MNPRMTHPALIVPGAMEALQAVGAAVGQGGVSPQTLELVCLRASQINGCAVCLEGHTRALRKLGESDERLATVAAWRETPWFTDAERAALALTEAGTRLADQPEAVRDEVWAEAARHYDEIELGSLVLAIANINVWNRLNAVTGQVAGSSSW